jgi:small subunit ribosomal protein S20|tara:strand:+ start:354 stop:617 length:264 start_codon:yes stop_codon:yes gene_type:complete
MANTKSAKGKVREISKKTDINKSVRNRYRTYIKKVELNIVKGDKALAQEALKSAESEMMSAVSKKILHKNTASRKISRLVSKIKSIK